jgi:hypothetical protein
MLSIAHQLPDSKLTVFNIYHPPRSSTVESRVCKPHSVFLQNLHNLFSIAATIPNEVLIIGDFNLHLDNLVNVHIEQFLTLLDSAKIKQQFANLPIRQVQIKLKFGE